MTDAPTAADEAELEEPTAAQEVEEEAQPGALELREQDRIFDPKVVQIAVKLEEAGAITPVSFELDEGVPIEKWLAIMGYFGAVNKASRFWLGDAINWGVIRYGEDAFQATEEGLDFTPAESVTGLSGAYLRELARVCENVAAGRRKAELTFGHHREVYHLAPDDQSYWLQQAIDNDWTRDQLRREIRQAGSHAQDPLPDPGPPTMSPTERIVEAAQLVWTQAQKQPDGKWEIDDDYMVQLGSALGDLD